MEGWEQPGGSQEFERGLRKVAQRGGTFLLLFPFFFLLPSIVAGDGVILDLGFFSGLEI